MLRPRDDNEENLGILMVFKNEKNGRDLLLCSASLNYKTIPRQETTRV